MAEQQFVLFGSPFSEATFDEKKRTAEVTVIKKGWSKNGFYYTDRALGDIASHLSETAHKVYLNHNERSKVFEPRKVEDHVATNQSAYVAEDHSVKATSKFLASGPNAWLFDRVQEAPDSLGPSIVGKAVVKKGEAEGRKGNIVETVPWLHSYDMVSGPSAGGTVDTVFEAGTMYIGEELTTWLSEQDTVPTAPLPSLKAKIVSIKKEANIRDKFGDIRWTLDDMISDLVFANNDFQFMTIANRRAAVKIVLDDFALELAKVPFSDPKPLPKKEGIKEAEDKFTVGDVLIEEEVTYFDISEGVHGVLKNEEVIGYWFDKNIYVSEDKVIEWCNNNLVEEGVDSMTIKNLAELRSQYPEMYAALIKEAVDEQAAVSRLTELEEEVKVIKPLEDKAKNLQEQVTTLTDEKKVFEDENKKLKDSAEAVEVERKSLTIDRIISETKKESELPDEVFTEVFENDLKSVAFEDEEKFKAAVKLRIDDRKAVVGKTTQNVPVVAGAGMPSADGTTIVTESDLIKDNKKAAALLKQVA